MPWGPLANSLADGAWYSESTVLLSPKFNMLWPTIGFKLFFAALMAGGAAAQSVSDMIADVPSCAVSNTGRRECSRDVTS